MNGSRSVVPMYKVNHGAEGWWSVFHPWMSLMLLPVLLIAKTIAEIRYAVWFKLSTLFMGERWTIYRAVRRKVFREICKHGTFGKLDPVEFEKLVINPIEIWAWRMVAEDLTTSSIELRKSVGGEEPKEN